MSLMPRDRTLSLTPATAVRSLLLPLLVCAATLCHAAVSSDAAQSSTAPITYIWPDCDPAHPCVVHHIDTVGDGTASGETLQDFKFPMIPSSPGNLLVFTVMHASSKAITVTDNNNGAWQTAVTTTNATDGETSELLYICGAAAGTNLITVHLSEPAVSGEPLHFTYDEVSGIAPTACLDGTAAANGLTGTVQPGPVTTTADGDMIFNYGEETYAYPRYDSPIGNVTTDSSAALLMENTVDKYASEVSLQVAHGAYTPTLYVNADPNPRSWNSVAAAFIPSPGAGTQPTGIHVTRILHYVGIVENSVSVPFPSSGNAIVISTSNPSDGSWAMMNLTDSAGHTYTRTPFAKVDTDPQIFSTCLCSGTGSQDLVISWIPSALNNHLLFYDIAGARTTGGSTGCVGATVNTVTGNQPSSPDAPISGDPVITPTTAGSLIIATSYFGTGPPSASLTPGVIFNSIYATGMIDPSNWDTGDPFAYVYTTSTSPISFDWQMANSNEESNGGTYFDGAAIEILAADSVAPPALIITPASLPNGTVNVQYSVALAATGGQSPYNWSVASGSSLPAGLQLNAGGVISGTPTASGAIGFTVQVTDSESTPATATASFSITIGTVPPPLTIAAANLPNGTVNVPYSAALAATGGQSPYTWALCHGEQFAGGIATECRNWSDLRDTHGERDRQLHRSGERFTVDSGYGDGEFLDNHRHRAAAAHHHGGKSAQRHRQPPLFRRAGRDGRAESLHVVSGVGQQFAGRVAVECRRSDLRDADGERDCQLHGTGERFPVGSGHRDGDFLDNGRDRGTTADHNAGESAERHRQHPLFGRAGCDRRAESLHMVSGVGQQLAGRVAAECRRSDLRDADRERDRQLHGTGERFPVDSGYCDGDFFHHDRDRAATADHNAGEPAERHRQRPLFGGAGGDRRSESLHVVSGVGQQFAGWVAVECWRSDLRDTDGERDRQLQCSAGGFGEPCANGNGRIFHHDHRG